MMSQQPFKLRRTQRIVIVVDAVEIDFFRTVFLEIGELIGGVVNASAIGDIYRGRRRGRRRRRQIGRIKVVGRRRKRALPIAVTNVGIVDEARSNGPVSP